VTHWQAEKNQQPQREFEMRCGRTVGCRAAGVGTGTSAPQTHTRTPEWCDRPLRSVLCVAAGEDCSHRAAGAPEDRQGGKRSPTGARCRWLDDVGVG